MNSDRVAAPRTLRASIILALTCLALAASATGCQEPIQGTDPITARPQPRDEAAFGPTAMRLHPVFTRLKDWNGDDVPDGVEAMVEFQDAFGDPTKASGRIIFELYEFRAAQPDPRGPRVANPWVGSLATLADQRDRWNRASRTYTFPLALARIDAGRTYVVTAQFDDATSSRRFFDRLILEGRHDDGRDRGGESLSPAGEPPPPSTRPAIGATGE